LLFDPMREALARGMLWTPPPITPDWVDNSWAQGAAALATRRIFDFEASSGADVCASAARPSLPCADYVIAYTGW
jgi:hypothetical protein